MRDVAAAVESRFHPLRSCTMLQRLCEADLTTWSVPYGWSNKSGKTLKRRQNGVEMQLLRVNSPKMKRILTIEGLSFAMATTSFQDQFRNVSSSTPNVAAATSSISYRLRKYNAQRRWTGFLPCGRIPWSTSFFHRIAQVLGLAPKWARKRRYSLSKLRSVSVRWSAFLRCRQTRSAWSEIQPCSMNAQACSWYDIFDQEVVCCWKLAVLMMLEAWK